jgi:magnesium-transporting ATPase (P-type)
MDKLYEYILEGLRNLSQTKQTENKFIAYLQSLQVEVKNLRQSYRNNSVSVNYSRVEVQSAYLITYYPQYAEMTRHILEQVELSHKTLFLFEQKHLEVCLFGAGAAPEVVGLVSFKDHIKTSSKKTIQLLKDLGIKTVMLTGDNQGSAKAVASELGIDIFHAEVRPEDKAKIIDSVTIGDNPDGIIFDPVNKLIFTANGDGTISVISQISANDYSLIESIPTKRGSNSFAFDETTLSLYVPGADQESTAKTSSKQPTLTKWIPSSFQVMVLDKEK